MTFTILTEDDVKHIFQGLTLSDVHSLADTLHQALAQYSCNGEQEYQPHRSVVQRPGGQVSLFMPATTAQAIGVKIVGVAPSPSPGEVTQKPQAALQSALTICDALGRATGVLNAAVLTAFRTALGSMLLYRLRKTTNNIVVFGAGKQALWHIRLAVLLRGSDIRKVTIVNRSMQRALDLVDELQESGWATQITLETFDRQKQSDEMFESLVAEADAIFCTTPSTKPLFPAAFLTSDQAQVKSRFISAIGSYRLDMAEIDPELLKLVTNPSGAFSKQVFEGKIAVDSRQGCLAEAGELVEAGIDPDQMLEVGQIPHGTKASISPDMSAWLESGFVIYKSVGTGVMDIAIGQDLMELAKSKSVGTHLQSF